MLQRIQDVLLSSVEKQENIMFFRAKLNQMFQNQATGSSRNRFLNIW